MSGVIPAAPVTMSEPKSIVLKDRQALRALIERWRTLDPDAMVDYIVKKLVSLADADDIPNQFIPDKVGWREFLTTEIIEMAPLLETVANEQAEERKKRKSSEFLDLIFGEDA